MGLTEGVIIATIAALLVFDLWTLIRNGEPSTISHVIRSLATRYPIIAFLFGLLMGHFFWPNP